MQKSAKSTTATHKGFTEEERAAIRDRAEEMKAGKGEGESAVLAKIAEMREPDRTMPNGLNPLFKTRYATFGFSDKANLDEGNTWPAAYALKGLTAAEEARIAALVKKAVS